MPGLDEALAMLGIRRPPQMPAAPPMSPEQVAAIEAQQGPAARAFPKAIEAAMGLLGLTGEAERHGESDWARGAEMLSAAAPLVGLPKALKATRGIKAYHGSPHDFDRFDLSKIGTGEGAQAYGHGLYFAEAEDTAQYYKDILQSARRRAEPVVYQGKEYPRGSMYHQPLIGVAESGKRQIVDELEQSIRFNRDYAPDQARLQESILEFVQGVDEQALSVPRGRMYEVQINADPESLLDWDKPLSQQLPVVERAQAAGIKTKLPLDWPNPPRGEHLAVAARDVAGNEAAGSRALREAGIPGIKYLDQGSRTAGEGTRNYVMFDDSIIDILKKYGLLPAAVGLGLVGAEQ